MIALKLESTLERSRVERRGEKRREERSGLNWMRLVAVRTDGQRTTLLAYLLTLSVCVCVAGPTGWALPSAGSAVKRQFLPACLPALIGTYYLLGNIRR